MSPALSWSVRWDSKTMSRMRTWFVEGEPVRLSTAATDATGLREKDTIVTVVHPQSVTRAKLSCPHCRKEVERPVSGRTAYYLTQHVEGKCCDPFPEHWIWKDYRWYFIGTEKRPAWAPASLCKR